MKEDILTFLSFVVVMVSLALVLLAIATQLFSGV